MLPLNRQLRVTQLRAFRKRIHTISIISQRIDLQFLFYRATRPASQTWIFQWCLAHDEETNSADIKLFRDASNSFSSARNKTRVPQNIRSSRLSKSPTYIGPRRHMHLSFLFFSFSFFLSCDSSKWPPHRGSRDKNRPVPRGLIPPCGGHGFRFRVPRIRRPETPPVKQSAP